MPKQYNVSEYSYSKPPEIYRPVIENILSFEIEDRFHAEFPDFEVTEGRSRIIPLIMHLLDLLDDQKAQATFFVLGWVARKFPEVVALIASRGNEIASHGFTHGDIRMMSPAKFREELIRSREILENIVGKAVYGYKAACPHLDRHYLPYYRIIAEAGYRYDCSLSAAGPRLDRQTPISISIDEGRSIFAIPQSARRKWGVAFRFGENLRIYPGWFCFSSLRKLNGMGIPGMINMKLWELDLHHPRSAGMGYVKYTKFGNLNLVEEKLYRLLDEFKFSTAASALKIQ